MSYSFSPNVTALCCFEVNRRSRWHVISRYFMKLGGFNISAWWGNHRESRPSLSFSFKCQNKQCLQFAIYIKRIKMYGRRERQKRRWRECYNHNPYDILCILTDWDVVYYVFLRILIKISFQFFYETPRVHNKLKILFYNVITVAT